MDKVIGAQRAQALRDSGMIDWKPCAITGSTEEHMKVWFFLHVLRNMFKELKKRIIKQYLSELFEQTLWTEIFENTWKKMSNIFDKVLRNSNEKNLSYDFSVHLSASELKRWSDPAGIMDDLFILELW